MAETTPEIAELHQAAISASLADVYVAMPGTVISYDAATQTAKIRPGVNRTVFDEEDNAIEEVIPPFENVPVMFFRTATLSIHANLEPGDGVRLIFCSDGTTEWRQGSVPQVTPGDLKRLGLSYPTCEPGFFANTNPGTDTDESIGAPGGLRVHFTSETINVGSGSAFVALANLVAIELAKIQATLATGTCAAAPGPVVFGTPYSPGGVGSSNLKAD